MNPAQWQWPKRLTSLLAVAGSEPAQRAARIVAIQRNIILPIRLLIVTCLYYYFYFSPWQADVVTAYGVIFETTRSIFDVYATAVVVAIALFVGVRHFPPGIVKWLVFALGLGDAVMLGLVTVLTGGFESVLYWVYPGMIILNAVSIPLEPPQFILNLALTIFFVVACLVESSSAKIELNLPSVPLRRADETAAEFVKETDLADLPALAGRLVEKKDPLARVFWHRLPKTIRDQLIIVRTNAVNEVEIRRALVEEMNRLAQPPHSVVIATPLEGSSEVAPALQVLRVLVLVLLTFSVYGVQVLAARQREAQAEHDEFVGRTERLRAAGRVAAEFAHQIKNPLTIINNLAFSLQKSSPADAHRNEMIREEIAKVDRIIVQIMGYAQLSEGRVEKLDVKKEIEHALQAVFPDGMPSEIKVQRDCAGEYPPLLMQRRHLVDTISNLLLNAREAVDGKGTITVRARRGRDDNVELSVRDDGPGIPPDKITRIFEAYYTTKERGTGLGLAIVKHNVELYGGTVRVQSELGKGAEFTVTFPGKTLSDSAT